MAYAPTSITIESRVLAPAVLPAGRIVARDGYPTGDDDPFPATIPPDNYPMYAMGRGLLQTRQGDRSTALSRALHMRAYRAVTAATTASASEEPESMRPPEPDQLIKDDRGGIEL